MESVRFQSRKSKVIMIALIIAVLAAGCFVAFFSKDASASAQTVVTISNNGTASQTLTATSSVVEFAFNTPDNLSTPVLSFEITGKNSRGKKIQMAFKENYGYIELWRCYSGTGCDGNLKKEWNCPSFKVVSDKNHKNILKIVVPTIALRGYTYILRLAEVQKGASYTLNIKPSQQVQKTSAKNNTCDINTADKFKIADSYIWLNLVPDSGWTIGNAEIPALVAYLNRGDLKLFCESIDNDKSVKNPTNSVISALWTTTKYAVGFIPVVGDATGAFEYIYSMLNVTASKTIYSIETQNKSYKKILRVLKDEKYYTEIHKKGGTGIKLTITNRGTVTAVKWKDTETTSLYSPVGYAGTFINIDNWNNIN